MLISFISTEYKTPSMPILLKMNHFIISTIGRLHLNKQVITLLSGLGVPDHVFLNLQEQEEMLIDMADMLLDDEKALSALMEVCYPKSDFMNMGDCTQGRI